ncbi:uncharacterized protein LOC124813253 [Hydra vulgaris]|uniref:uncharacterized protein LOC124813253 n=1 Tax=Hydra vulgaris TaxID=6087 RepID=UPI001F5EBE92|nr:uncharacterized protein LOC124813253 [Hydra vulgaris]
MQNHLKLRHPSNLVVAGRSGAGSSTSASNTLISRYFDTTTVVMNSAKKKEYRNKLAMMCVQDLRPINFVLGRGFRAVAQFLYPGAPPIGYTSIISRISLQFEARKSAIFAEVQAIMGQLNIYPCLTTDGWTSNSNEIFIAISIHLFDKNWNLVSYVINLIHSQERHTSVNLQTSLEAAMGAWHIPEAFAVVSDNAANIVLALTSSKRVQHMVQCVGHTSQLAINDSINALS